MTTEKELLAYVKELQASSEAKDVRIDELQNELNKIAQAVLNLAECLKVIISKNTEDWDKQEEVNDEFYRFIEDSPCIDNHVNNT